MAAPGRRPVMAVLLMLGMLHSAAATTYTIGDYNGKNGGWDLESSDDSFYDDQFKNVNVFVGDLFSFEFETGAHNVYEVTKAKLDNCDGTGAISSHNSSITIPLTTAGFHGFICTVPQHCSQFGMHLSVTVLAAPSPNTPPVSSPTTSSAPAISPSSPTTSPTPAKAPSSPTTSPAPAKAPTSPTTSPAPAKAPSSRTSPPAPAPSSPTTSPAPATSPSSPTSPTTPSPVTEGPGGPPAPPSGAASAIRSGPAMVVGAVLAGCAAMLF